MSTDVRSRLHSLLESKGVRRAGRAAGRAARRVAPGKSKIIKRVRTPEGRRWFQQDIGSVIVGKKHLTAMHIHAPVYDGYDRVERVRYPSPSKPLEKGDRLRWTDTSGKKPVEVFGQVTRINGDSVSIRWEGYEPETLTRAEIDADKLISRDPTPILTGEKYDLGYDWDAGKWRAYEADTQNVAFEADTEEKLFLGLNKQWEGFDERGHGSGGVGTAQDPFARPTRSKLMGLTDMLGYDNTINDDPDLSETPGGLELADIISAYDLDAEGQTHAGGMDEVEFYAALSGWLDQHPMYGDPKATDAQHQLHEIATSWRNELGRLIPALKRMSTEELDDLVRERGNQRSAQAMVPRPIRASDVGIGNWIRVVDADGPSHWMRVRATAEQWGTSRLINVDYGNGTQGRKFSINSRTKLETIHQPSPVDLDREREERLQRLQDRAGAKDAAKVFSQTVINDIYEGARTDRYGDSKAAQSAAWSVEGQLRTAADKVERGIEGRSHLVDVLDAQMARPVVQKHPKLVEALQSWRTAMAPASAPSVPAEADPFSPEGMARDAMPYEQRVADLKKYAEQGPNFNRRIRDELERAAHGKRKGEGWASPLLHAEVAAGLRPESDYEAFSRSRRGDAVSRHLDALEGYGPPTPAIESATGVVTVHTPSGRAVQGPKELPDVEIHAGRRTPDWRNRDIDEDTAAEMADEYAKSAGFKKLRAQWDNFELWRGPGGEKYDFGYDEDRGKLIITRTGEWEPLAEGDDWRETFFDFMQWHANDADTVKAPPPEPEVLSGDQRAAALMSRLRPLEPAPVAAQPPRTRLRATDKWVPYAGQDEVGDGMPTGAYLAAKAALKDRDQSKLNKVDRLARRRQEHDKLIEAFAELDAAMPDGKARDDLRKWFRETFTEVSDERAPIVTAANLDEAAAQIERMLGGGLRGPDIDTLRTQLEDASMPRTRTPDEVREARRQILKLASNETLKEMLRQGRDKESESIIRAELAARGQMPAELPAGVFSVNLEANDIPAHLKNVIYASRDHAGFWTVRLPNGNTYDFPNVQAALRFYEGNVR